MIDEDEEQELCLRMASTIEEARPDWFVRVTFTKELRCPLVRVRPGTFQEISELFQKWGAEYAIGLSNPDKIEHLLASPKPQLSYKDKGEVVEPSPDEVLLLFVHILRWFDCALEYPLPVASKGRPRPFPTLDELPNAIRGKEWDNYKKALLEAMNDD